MRTLTLTHDYATGLPDFLGVLADSATWEELGSQASAQRVDADTEVTVRTPIPTGELPAMLASRLPAGAELVEVYMVPGDVFGDAAEVRMTAHAPGMPVEIDALLALAAAGTGTTLTARAEISSSVPIFGSMIEQALVPVLEKRLAQRLDALDRS